MAFKTSYSNALRQPSYGVPKQQQLPGTTNLNAQTAAIARTLAAQSAAVTAPYSSSGAQARAGVGTGGALNTPVATPPAFQPAQGNQGAPTPPASTPSTGAAGTTFADYNDPVIAQIQAAGQQSVQSAQAARDAAVKQALIGFGDSTLASKLTGGDTLTAQAAQQNPTSTLAQLLHQHQVNQQAIDQARNAQNLYYSSTRANDLSQEGQQNLFDQAGAQSTLQQLLGGYDQTFQGIKDMASQNVLDALPGAYDRWKQLPPPVVTPAGSGGDTGGAGGDVIAPPPTHYGFGAPLTAPDFWTALALAARGAGRNVAV